MLHTLVEFLKHVLSHFQLEGQSLAAAAALKSREVKRSMLEFSLGQKVCHKVDGWRGVIAGFDVPEDSLMVPEGKDKDVSAKRISC